MERDATVFEKFLVSLTKVLRSLDFLIKLEPTGRFNQKRKYMCMLLVIVTKVLSLYYVFFPCPSTVKIMVEMSLTHVQFDQR